MIKNDQDHTCEFCYYEFFDDKAYPCSRCVCNQPTENMWRPKIKDEPQIDCRTCKHNESGWYEKGSLSCGRCCGISFEFYEPKDEPQERSEK